MTPSEVKSYLVERQRAGLGEIAVHFGSSPDAVRQLLTHWQAKGRVRVLAPGGCAGGCSCAKRPDDIYEWVPPA